MTPVFRKSFKPVKSELNKTFFFKNVTKVHIYEACTQKIGRKDFKGLRNVIIIKKKVLYSV